jgi:hypothetical protein
MGGQFPTSLGSRGSVPVIAFRERGRDDRVNVVIPTEYRGNGEKESRLPHKQEHGRRNSYTRHYMWSLLKRLWALIFSRPVKEPIRLIEGITVFSGWKRHRTEFNNNDGGVPRMQCPAEYPWLEFKTSDRKMAFGIDGTYDESDPEITTQRLQLMQYGRFDFACYQIEWAHNQTQPTLLSPWTRKIDPLLMSHCADNHSPNSPIKFCISLWDVMACSNDKNYWEEMKMNGWTYKEMEASWRLYARMIAERYMTKPNYLTMADGRLVLFEGWVHGLEFYSSEFGVSPERIIQILREEILAVTGKQIYLIATSTSLEFIPRIAQWGFDAFTEYLLYSDNWKNVMNVYRGWWYAAVEICKTTGLEFWVPTTCGYDSTAWGNPVKDIFIPTASQLEDHLKEAREFTKKNIKFTKGFLINYAWNEIGEGGIMEPMQNGQLHNGDEMLQAHRRAVGI